MPGRKRTVSNETILHLFSVSSDPVLTTTEVAEPFDLTTQGMGDRLRELEEKGLIGSKKAGRARVWWLTEEGKTAVEETFRDQFSESSDNR